MGKRCGSASAVCPSGATVAYPLLALCSVFSPAWPATAEPAAPSTGRLLEEPAATPAAQPVRLGPVETIMVLANAGNAEAQFILGGLHDRGDGVRQDAEQAAAWWRKAAEQGHADAQNELGAALVAGIGVAADSGEAVQWYRRAAERGHAVAQANLGNMYAAGEGVRKSLREAAEWHRRAADQGLGWAQYYLGEAYRRGLGVRLSNSTAAGWYRKAAEQDYADAQLALASMIATYPNDSVPRNDDSRESLSAYWTVRAALNGSEAAEASLEQRVAVLRKVKIAPGAPIRERPHADAMTVRLATDVEIAVSLPDTPGAGWRRRWTAIYAPDGHTVGYVHRDDLR